MAKNLSPIGYMMELLHVSVQELAQYLYIDRTTISKWRTGARKLSERSPYYDEMTNYFVKRNNELGNKPLAGMFRDLYPNEPCESDAELIKLIKIYLADEKSSARVSKFVDDMNHALYQSNVSIFKGSDGRKSALGMLLSVAESSATPCTIKMFETSQFEWLSRDMADTAAFLDRIDYLSKLGHKFILSYPPEAHAGSAAFKSFIRSLSSQFFNKNIKINIIQTYKGEMILPNLYGIDGKCAIMGVNFEENLDNAHTAVYFDDFTIKKYMMIHDKMVDLYTAPFMITDTISDKKNILEMMHYSRTRKEPTYFYGMFLPCATMNEELIKKVLDQNHLSAGEKERCMNLYNMLRSSLIDSPPDSFGGLYLLMDQLTESLTYDTIVQYELSAFCSDHPVIMFRDQYLQHFSDTHQFVEKYSNVKIHATQGAMEYETPVSCVWIRRNLWSLSVNQSTSADENKLIFVDEPPLVNLSADMCEEALQNFPLKYKNSTYISSVLERIGRGEEV